MYRAIVCIADGYGALQGPNPVFRTREGCQEYWLDKMVQYGPAIESFVPMKISKGSNETRTDLARVAMTMRLKVEPDMREDMHKIEKVWEMYKNTTPWKLDEAIGVMIDVLYKRKHKMAV